MVTARWLEDEPQVARVNEYARDGNVVLEGLRPGKWSISVRSMGRGRRGRGESESQAPESREIVVKARERGLEAFTLP